MLPSPRTKGLGLRIVFFSRPLMGSLALRPGDSLTIPRMALSVGFLRFVYSAEATRATGVLTLPPVGLTPTEHASLRWTHPSAKTPSDGTAAWIEPPLKPPPGLSTGPNPSNLHHSRKPPYRLLTARLQVSSLARGATSFSGFFEEKAHAARSCVGPGVHPPSGLLFKSMVEYDRIRPFPTSNRHRNRHPISSVP